ncbi:hypothetical protein EBO34_12410 [Alteribacter keqinensis]|uniref:Uncharacterized protein n=1 Tax=Alteribacter keqinensis TaxID=2483800 RepID=A0A3M7TPG4_9BACI|nr:hypothetical protein EBO34_12410 [Alteribacter keqinensis]
MFGGQTPYSVASASKLRFSMNNFSFINLLVDESGWASGDPANEVRRLAGTSAESEGHYGCIWYHHLLIMLLLNLPAKGTDSAFTSAE